MIFEVLPPQTVLRLHSRELPRPAAPSPGSAGKAAGCGEEGSEAAALPLAPPSSPGGGGGGAIPPPAALIGGCRPGGLPFAVAAGRAGFPERRKPPRPAGSFSSPWPRSSIAVRGAGVVWEGPRRAGVRSGET